MALPMDGYIRVSQVAGREGERFHSPTEQREAIEGWARLHGVKLGLIHTDLDRSGSTMDRPGMNAAVKRIRDGKSSGLIVAKIDRFARTVVGGLTTIEELHRHGARVVSVAEGINPESAIGEAMIGLLLIMARWHWRQADEALEQAQARAVSKARYPGRPSYGYGRDDAGLTFVDNAAAAIVRRIFEERAAGNGWRSIADGLTRDGIPTPHNGRAHWAPTTVSDIVRGKHGTGNEAPLGVFVGPRGLRVEDAWPAIVDRDVWERANAVRGVRDDARRYEDRLFAGIARCAGCRRVLTRQINPDGFVSYGCPTKGCKGGGSIGAHLLDPIVAAVVDERLARILLEPRVADDGAEWRRLKAARDRAVEQLELWRDDLEMQAALGAHDWREGMLARARARDDAEVALAEYRAANGMPDLDLPAGVVPALDALPWPVRRSVVEALLHSVWLRPSEIRGRAAAKHADRRLRVVFADDPNPPALPSRSGADDLGPVRW